MTRDFENKIIDNVLEVRKPQNPLPLVFDSPHSGQQYPDDFNFTCSFHDLKLSEDLYVDEFFDTAHEHDACFLAAHFPRSYIDVNRSLNDIDPLLLEKPWPDHHSTTPRAHAGIGLIRRLLKSDYPIYAERLSLDETKKRITLFYEPYHQALSDMIENLHQEYDQVWHVNCHSMPSTGKAGRNRFLSSPLSDFVLGDLDGVSCARDFSHMIRDFLQSKGYSVALNDPYKGVEIVDRHGDPALNRHSIQLEINKALYVNEKTGEKTDNFGPLQNDIKSLMAHISEFVKDQQVPLAAD